MNLTKIPQEIEQQAAYWYVRIQSPELTPQQESEFFAWLESSSIHQAAFVRIEQAWVAGGSVQKQARKKTFSFNLQLSFGLSAAAAVLVAALLMHLSSLNHKQVAPVLEKYVALTEQQTLTLPDSSSVVLSPNSHIEVLYSESVRELYLHKGQIFLSVTQDAVRPFRVITSQGIVRVIGTQFEIQKLAGDMKITVVEGLVGLLKLDDANSSQRPLLVLSKNQQVLYSDALGGAVPTDVDATRETSWTKGRMIFDGAPLIEVVAKLNEHLSQPIRIASPELQTKRIVGAVSIKNPRATAASLASIAGAVVEETPAKDALLLKLL